LAPKRLSLSFELLKLRLSPKGAGLEALRPSEQRLGLLGN